MRNEKRIEELYLELIKEIGEDPNREGIVDTPKRAAKALSFLTKGYQENLDDIVNNAIFSSDNDDMVIVRNIELYSLCEHHLLPFIGKCNIAYIPNGKVIGLSKTARIVEVFARRLNHRFNNEEALRTRLINLQVSRANRPCFGNFFHYLKKSFNNDLHEVEINEIPDLILGVEMTDEKRADRKSVV